MACPPVWEIIHALKLADYLLGVQASKLGHNYILFLVSGETCSVTNYTGTVSITNGWRTCQLWSEQVPHRHAFTGNDYFPFDGSVEEAENYCRQVDGDKRPWCYTTDTYMRWQYCDDHICGGNLQFRYLGHS